MRLFMLLLILNKKHTVAEFYSKYFLKILKPVSTGIAFML
ncbi:hypothetical protein ACIRA0001_0310 [Acinetobacter radioresistens SK82]|uniref:Uncharacterized protein n=1 Tax=Acinetobacter radioresistens SK82 TaxID=596318 RepID=A0ABP2GSW4_ACIRA|nr:hypothetical protein ACIRA0001_0310 [Acinetobacter radioresistens SK82]EXB81993.1 hypothetical protein J538_2536 [Acinetobacter sp. 272263]EXE58033.1 hypothetical protein J579_1450 [Acinetobacter sp. 1239920]